MGQIGDYFIDVSLFCNGKMLYTKLIYSHFIASAIAAAMARSKTSFSVGPLSQGVLSALSPPQKICRHVATKNSYLITLLVKGSVSIKTVLLRGLDLAALPVLKEVT